MCQSRAPFTLTLTGVSRESAAAIKDLLDRAFSEGDWRVAKGLPGLVARSNVRCKEIDAYVEKARPQYLASIEEKKRQCAEWASSSARDQEDLLAGFRDAAIDSLPIRPDCDLEALFECEPRDATIDDAFIDRFGFSTLQFYFRYAHDLDKVRVVPANQRDRKEFEDLVAKGLARTGSALPVEAAAGALKVKDLNELIGGSAPKPFTRKAAAVAALAALPDARDRLSKAVAFRELFQLLSLPPDFAAIDVRTLTDNWRYAGVTGDLLLATYTQAADAHRTIQQVKEDSGFYTGWEIVSWAEDRCSACRTAAEKVYSRRTTPKVPVHIGCRCRLNPTYKS